MLAEQAGDVVEISDHSHPRLETQGHGVFATLGHVACGPDVARHLEVAQPYVDDRPDHVVPGAGPDPQGMTCSSDELAGPLRALTRGS